MRCVCVCVYVCVCVCVCTGGERESKNSVNLKRYVLKMRKYIIFLVF